MREYIISAKLIGDLVMAERMGEERHFSNRLKPLDYLGSFSRFSLVCVPLCVPVYYV